MASIELTARATDALRKRGSHLYIWADQAGMIHVRTKPPSKSANFETVERDGLAIHIELEIKPPTRWVITHTRLPWQHFNALYDPVEHGDRVGTVSTTFSGHSSPPAQASFRNTGPCKRLLA